MLGKLVLEILRSFEINSLAGARIVPFMEQMRLARRPRVMVCHFLREGQL